MPPQLIGKIAGLSVASGGALDRIAVVTDMRGGNMFYGLCQELDKMKEEGHGYKMLFLDASDEELIRRYKETRRRHPMADIVGGGLAAQIAAERKAMAEGQKTGGLSDRYHPAVGIPASETAVRDFCDRSQKRNAGQCDVLWV